jgi:hypothetical protein
VFSSLISELTNPVKGALRLAGWGAAVAIPALLGFLFFLYAAFVWAERTYGTLDASLLLGTSFLVIACLILATAIILRRRELKRPRPGNNPQWWKDPTVLAAGIELVRIVGVRRIIPVVALGAVIAGALETGLDRKPRREEPR